MPVWFTVPCQPGVLKVGSGTSKKFLLVDSPSDDGHQLPVAGPENRRAKVHMLDRRAQAPLRGLWHV